MRVAMHSLTMFLFTFSWAWLWSELPTKVIAVSGSIYALIQMLKQKLPGLQGNWAVLLNLVASFAGIFAVMPKDQFFTVQTMAAVITAFVGAGGIHGIVKTVTGLNAPSANTTNPTAAKIVSMLLVGVLLCGGLTGCPGQQTAVELLGVVEQATVSLATLEGNTADIAKLQADFAAAQTAITNFKSGTPAQDVIEALNIVQDDLNLLPVPSGDKALVDLAIGTVDELLALFPAPAATPAVTAAVYRVGAAQLVYAGAAHVKHRHPGLPKPVATPKDFKKLWNAELAKHPRLAAAKVK